MRSTPPPALPTRTASPLTCSVRPTRRPWTATFDWMQQYGIDGVFLQRFLVDLKDRSLDRVLASVQKSANRTGRVFAIGYDLTDAPKDKVYDLLVADWKRLVDEKKGHAGRSLPAPQQEAGRVRVGFLQRPLRPGPRQPHHRLLQERPQVRSHAHRRLSVVVEDRKGPRNGPGCSAASTSSVRGTSAISSRWTVRKQASTGYWKEDLEEAKKAGMGYLPVIYPGFGWTNLKGKERPRTTCRVWGASFTGGSFPPRRTLASRWPTSPCLTRWTREPPSSKSATPRPGQAVS